MDGEQRRLDLWVWDCASRQRLGHATASGAPGQLGAAAIQLLAELSPLVGGPPGLKPPVGEGAWWERYIAGLGQHAALVVAQMGAMPKDRLFGQRSILEWLLAVTLDEPRWQPARFLFASALCTDAALGSRIHKEMAQPLVELFRMEPAQTPFARVAVKPLTVLGLGGAWQARRHEIVPQASDAAVAWIRRIEGGGKQV
jgi:hypothetical protein